MSFIIFTVAFAVVRSLFNRAWAESVPTKSDWKQNIKNKISRFNRKLDEKKINDPDAKEKFLDNQNGEKPAGDQILDNSVMKRLTDKFKTVLGTTPHNSYKKTDNEEDQEHQSRNGRF